MRFGKEDTAKELQDHAADTQDTLVDAVENAEVRSRPRGTSFFDLHMLRQRKRYFLVEFQSRLPIFITH